MKQREREAFLKTLTPEQARETLRREYADVLPPMSRTSEDQTVTYGPMFDADGEGQLTPQDLETSRLMKDLLAQKTSELRMASGRNTG